LGGKRTAKKTIAASNPLTDTLGPVEIRGSEKENVPLYSPNPGVITAARELVSQIKNALKQTRFQRIKEQLKGVSSEINQDKKQLVRKYADLKFNTALIEALERLDSEVEEVGTKFEYSKGIGFVRKIYEESLRQIATKLHDITGKPIPKWTGKGKMGEAIDYLRKTDFISDKERNMLTGFSGMISDTGSHSLTSERYEVRIAKNILIEICCYLTDKLDSFLSMRPK
jgi:hypothetical protein